jgi:hypothetical protein
MHMRLLALLSIAALTACGGQAGVSAGDGNQERGLHASVVEQCFGGEPRAETTDRYNGLSEDEALAQARAESDGGARVVARNDECLPRRLNLQAGRVNLVVNDGVVVWAAVEHLPS